MRAVIVEQPGGLDHVHIRDVPPPVPGRGQVTIAVHHAGCNWSDIQKRQGVYPDPVTYPAILGLEVSGTVAALGAGVESLSVGRRVAAITGPTMLGGFAEVVAVDAGYVIPLPDDIDDRLGAAFPVIALTAWHLLFSAHALQSGETVLIHAIGGGVGLMLTQLAVAHGARVFGTVGRAAKADKALALGAERVVVRDTEDFVDAAMALTGGRGVDLVIDSLGGDTLRRSFDALKVYGRVINIGEASGYPDFDIRAKLYERSTALAGFELVHADPGSARWQNGVDAVLARLRDGRLSVPIEHIAPLDRVRDAQALLESRGVAGKVLLHVGDGAT